MQQIRRYIIPNRAELGTENAPSNQLTPIVKFRLHFRWEWKNEIETTKNSKVIKAVFVSWEEANSSLIATYISWVHLKYNVKWTNVFNKLFDRLRTFGAKWSRCDFEMNNRFVIFKSNLIYKLVRSTSIYRIRVFNDSLLVYLVSNFKLFIQWLLKREIIYCKQMILNC